MNVECGQEAIDEIVDAFRFNDAILRHLVLAKKKAETEDSPLKKEDEEKAAKVTEEDVKAIEAKETEAKEEAAKEEADKEDAVKEEATAEATEE